MAIFGSGRKSSPFWAHFGRVPISKNPFSIRSANARLTTCILYFYHTNLGGRDTYQHLLIWHDMCNLHVMRPERPHKPEKSKNDVFWNAKTRVFLDRAKSKIVRGRFKKRRFLTRPWFKNGPKKKDMPPSTELEVNYVFSRPVFWSFFGRFWRSWGPIFGILKTKNFRFWTGVIFEIFFKNGLQGSFSTV